MKASRVRGVHRPGGPRERQSGTAVPGSVASGDRQRGSGPAARPAGVEATPVVAPGQGTKSALRRRLGPTAALSAVLIALGAYVILGTLQNTRATQEQSRVLTVDALFAEARTAIALQEVHLRHYQVEPAVAVRDTFAANADSTVAALARIEDTASSTARADARRLRAEQSQYRQLATRLIALIAERDPAYSRFDMVEVTPAYYTLQQDIDQVSRKHHNIAEQQASALRDSQAQMLLGTSVGFAVGLAMVAMIWRVVLGYQHRLVEQADASRHQALHDPLTGLPNRVLFADRMRTALHQIDVAGPLGPAPPETAAPGPGQDAPTQHVALLVIDLNGFKAVNDTLGHAAGDQLLVEAGRRLAKTGRRGDIVARLGGDEFAVLLPDVPDLRTARLIAHRLADALRRDFVLDSGPAAVSGSIGIALSPLHGGEDDLLRFADSAMYRAKAKGGGVAVYDPRLDAEMPNRMTLFAELRALLDADDPGHQLVLYYQPQVQIRDGAVTGLEALVRWQHPERGLLLPKDFLPIAEARGLEVPLTYHLLEVAVRQAAAWHAAGRQVTVAVNISPRCLLDAEFVRRVRGTLDAHLLPPQKLRLEITETSIMSDPERAVAAVREVHAFGVSVSVDDFGTGFSSLAQLKRLPADELKIDQTFIREMRPNSEDELVVRSSIDLAHNMGLSVVAEGVEDLAVLARLAEMDCDYAQGFVLSRPVPVSDVDAACVQAQERARSAAVHAAAPQPATN